METQGYFGKTPQARDFVFHGLPMKVTDLWAEQMAQWLAVARQAAAANWQRSYLGSPVWRFALPPGILGAQAWIGLFASSIDSVGREFPFTVMMTAEIEVPGTAPSEPLDALLDPVETQMLAFMEGQIKAEELRDNLQRTSPSVRSAIRDARGATLAIEPSADALCEEGEISGQGTQFSWPAAGKEKNKALCSWWSEGTSRRQCAVCVSRGLLPTAAGSLFFLDDWTQRWGAPAHAAGRG